VRLYDECKGRMKQGARNFQVTYTRAWLLQAPTAFFALPDLSVPETDGCEQ